MPLKPTSQTLRKGGMTDSEWKELERDVDAVHYRHTERYEDLLEKSTNVEMHPDWYRGPCLCNLCCG